MPTTSRQAAQARQAQAQSDTAAVSLADATPEAGFVAFLEAADVDTFDAIIRAREPRKWRERVEAEDSLVLKLNATEGRTWLDAARTAYNAAVGRLRFLGYRDAGDFMSMQALTREVTLAMHGRHVASPSEFATLTKPLAGYFEVGG